MLRPRIATPDARGVDGHRTGGRSDLAMDVLQYGMAILAIVVAVVLAALR
jgi:hypothetical protein